MTCSHADENCLVVLGMEKQVLMKLRTRYMTEQLWKEKISRTLSEQIAREMFFFSKNLKEYIDYEKLNFFDKNLTL